eukprot:gene5857-7286_t
MDKFNLSFRDNENNETSWIEILKQFNIDNANERTFVIKYGEKDKVEFTLNLFKVLLRELNTEESSTEKQQQPTSVALTEVLTGLRICLREITESETETVLKNLHVFLKFGNIGPDEKLYIYSDQIREESLKCIVNCISRNKDIQSKFTDDLNGPVQLVKELVLSSSSNTKLDDKILVPIYKILIHNCTNKIVREKVKAEGLLNHVADSRSTTNLEIFITTTQQLEKRILASEYESTGILSDLCRLLFTATIDLGPLEGKPATPTDADYTRYRRLLPIFKRIFTFHCSDSSHPMYSVKTALVSALLNTPKDLFDELVAEVPLPYFQEIFKIQIKTLDRPETSGEFLPILMLVTNFAEHVLSTRHPLKQMTFPAILIQDSDEPLSVGIEPPTEAKTQGISAKLIPFMTSNEIGLKHFVSEFFFMICDEDPNEVCRLTGFGNSAGLLVTRGLMKLGGQ